MSATGTSASEENKWKGRYVVGIGPGTGTGVPSDDMYVAIAFTGELTTHQQLDLSADVFPLVRKLLPIEVELGERSVISSDGKNVTVRYLSFPSKEVNDIFQGIYRKWDQKGATEGSSNHRWCVKFKDESGHPFHYDRFQAGSVFIRSIPSGVLRPEWIRKKEK